VLIPPSIHPSGVRYTAVEDSAPILSVKSLGDVIPNPPAPEIERVVPSPLVNVFPSSDLWPQTIIEKIKSRISILAYFTDAKPKGRNYYRATCLFHDDPHPSAWIDIARGICGCFTGCNGGKAMDVITLHARLHGISDKEAIKELAKERG